MASALSDEEFHRMQLQLLELRTASYELDNKCKKQNREIIVWREKSETLEKDLQKATKAINKSKKAKEVELLLLENDNLQRKLHSQEDEFRLQNETLMQELSSFVATNEDLERKLKSLTETGEQKETKPNDSRFEDEVRRLQAQNAVLQKKISIIDISPVAQHDGIPDKCTDDEADGGNTNCSGDDLVGGHDDINEAQNFSTAAEIQDYVSQINDLKLNLDTELEEKKILREQFASNERNLKEQLSSIQDELGKVTDKLKKKQDTFVRLQEEKETQFTESSEKIDELQAARERDQKHYTDQITKLQGDLHMMKQNLSECQTSSARRIFDLESNTVALQQQIDAAGIVATQQLHDQVSRYHHQVTDLQQQNARHAQENEDLLTQLHESQKASSSTLEQLCAAQQERDSQIQSLQEISKVAEKRKSLLDELAIKYQSEIDSHRDQVNKMEGANAVEFTSLQEQLEIEKSRASELDRTRVTLKELYNNTQSLTEAKGWLERRLQEVEDSMDASQTEHGTTIHELTDSHQEEIDKLNQTYQQEMEEIRQKEDILVQEIDEHKSSIAKLKQEIKDGLDGRKLHEKKGMSTLKDLKRQLQSERKRAEKLQERLQELLSDSSKHRSGVDELFQTVDHSDPLRGDSSSVSSWGASASGTGTKDSGGPNSPTTPGALSSPDELDEEHSEILSRLTGVQQEKWNLEYKVSHLEESNSAMAEDLLQKTAIIEHYVMDGRTDHRPSSSNDDKITLKKVLDLVNKNDDGVKEMNRKLQRMLEETLTKNMHLQRDMEQLSEEVFQMRKVVPS